MVTGQVSAESAPHTSQRRQVPTVFLPPPTHLGKFPFITRTASPTVSSTLQNAQNQTFFILEVLQLHKTSTKYCNEE